jgi:hypothetical protein
MEKNTGLMIVLGIFMWLMSCTNDKKPTASDSNNSNQPAKDSATMVKKKTIVFFGNSLTAGYG